ncbi:MAG: hypothetical protein R2865_03295 [Deinococcales bacterium]
MAKITLSQTDLEAIADEALAQTLAASSRYQFDKHEIYYTFADKSIVPTFLTRPLSRTQVDVEQTFKGLKGDISFFPAFGASMSFMRSRFARDVQRDNSGSEGGIHILPRVGLSDEARLEDVEASGARAAIALGINENDDFLEKLFAKDNLIFASVDIAHGANAAVLPILQQIRNLDIHQGIILGNVGSIEGFYMPTG